MEIKDILNVVLHFIGLVFFIYQGWSMDSARKNEDIIGVVYHGFWLLVFFLAISL